MQKFQNAISQIKNDHRKLQYRDFYRCLSQASFISIYINIYWISSDNVIENLDHQKIDSSSGYFDELC